MGLVENLTERKMIASKLYAYIIANKKEIEKEYHIDLPETLETMSDSKFFAWIHVYSSKIFLTKDVKECVELKDMVKEFILIDREVEISENTL